MGNKLRVLSLFSGIGAFEEALNNIGVDYDLVNYCEFESYIAKAYSLIHNVSEDLNLGDITKVDETKLKDFDLMTYGFPCFVEGTKVLTIDGYKNIENITNDDYVLTHKNRYRKVVKPMINNTNELYRLSTMCSDDLFVTEEHPFYVRKKERVYDKGSKQMIRNFSKPEWIKIKDLSKDYYVGVAINNKSEIPKWEGVSFKWNDGRKDRHSNILKDKFSMTEFWWLIGRYLGDGWIRHQGGIIICCDFDETEEIEDKLKILNFNYSIVKERTVNKIHIAFKEIGEYVKQFGRGAKNKKITGDIINLPINLLKGFLEGYMSADGCITQGYHKATSISNELIYGIGQCVAKVYNVPFSVYKTVRNKKYIIEGREVNQNDTYEIKWKDERKLQDKAFYEDGYIWCPINNIELIKLEKNIKVYNMEVEEDNSYVVQNIICHNCQDISALGNQKGFFDEDGNMTRSGLLFEAMRIAKYKKPKYMIAENVRALISKRMQPQFQEMLNMLDEMGYNSYYQVLNSKDYGIPHSRNRVFIVSIRKDVDDGTFKFPDKQDLKIVASDLYDKGNVSDEFYLEEKHHKYFNEFRLKKKYSSLNSDILVCMTTKQGQKSNPQNFIKDSKGYRILTDRELFAFQGFKREYGDLLKNNGFTTSQIGYMAGNSITVSVLEAIFKELFL